MRTVPGEGRLERTSCARVKKRRRRYERGTVTDRRRCFKQTSFRYFDICRTLRGVREVIEKGYSRAKNVAKPPPIPLKTSTRVHGVKRRGGHNASVITQNPFPPALGRLYTADFRTYFPYNRYGSWVFAVIFVDPVDRLRKSEHRNDVRALITRNDDTPAAEASGW